METIGKIVSALFIIIISNILAGWALSTVWGWFIVHTFNVVPISIPVAIGISLIARFLTVKAPTVGETVDLGTSMAFALLVPALFVGMSWVVKCFI